jgi:2-dehydropantoate 2-reductase
MVRIVVAGAGTIGCFIGGLLTVAGHKVTLYGRSRTLSELQISGLTLTDFAGMQHQLPPEQLLMSDDPSCLERGDIVLVCVKSAGTAQIAREIATYARPGTVVISLQNGLENGLILADALPNFDVRAGMVGFNIVAKGKGRFHRAVSGEIRIEQGLSDVSKRLIAPGLKVSETERIIGEQWGKLLLNLTNALNALSGLSLRDCLLDRGWRRLLADQLDEALAVLKAAQIDARFPLPVPSWLMPHALRLPTPIFRRIAGSMVTIDPQSSSSMAQDLAAGRLTEIDAFQGAIVALGQGYGVPTPINARVVQLVREAEVRGAGRPVLSPADLRPVS